MFRPLFHPRDEILDTIDRIYRFRMTTTSGGNLSIRDPSGDIWITPTRVDKGSLRREDIVCVRPDGSVEGLHPPSSEYPFHKAIYDARSDIYGIVHAHSVALVAFSICGAVPNARLLHRTYEVCGEAGFAPYALPGSTALADSIVKTFQQGFFAVILENHGVVVGGHNLHEAFARFETLEFTAKTIIKASTLGPVRYLSDEQLALAHKLDDKLPSFDPPPATSAEKELRLQLAAFLQRGYRNRLVISTQGSFSARLDEQAFLITPVNLDRQRAAVDDLVLVRGGAAETGKTASRATRLHQAIYERNPDVGAVFNAYTVNATAFGVTGSPPDARTIPESFLLLRDVQWIPFGQQFAACDAVAGQISMRNPIAILENDGVLVAGRNVLDAFDRLEVLEATAETLINGRLIGQPRPMSDKVIAELAEAFKGM